MNISTLKKRLKEALIWIIIITVASNVISYLRKPSLSSDMLPSIKMAMIDGRIFDSKMVEGKPLILHFWGVWCPVCKMEASNIQTLSEKYTVITIAVNSESNEEIREYMQKNGLDFDVINDEEGNLAKRFNVEVFPTTFIYDGKGKLRFSETGYTTTAGLLSRMAIVK
ncbi:MAG: protein disulfide oxidoreductase [Campylobacterales bacterium]|nr:protein disulfide oxidoreductase [Campylobacterales bacterium]